MESDVDEGTAGVSVSSVGTTQEGVEGCSSSSDKVMMKVYQKILRCLVILRC